MIKMKKAQMKIQQTAFMLIAIVIFFVFAGIFILSFKLSSLKQDANILNERNALLLITKIAESPEFSCGEAFGGKKANCVDFDKTLVLKKNINKYENFWGVSNIEIRRIDASGQDLVQEMECSFGNYPDCTHLRILSNQVLGSDYSTFVSLCRKEIYQGDIYDKCELAKFIISYQKNEE